MHTGRQPGGVRLRHFHSAKYPPSAESLDAAAFGRLLDATSGRVLPAHEFLIRAMAGKLRAHDLCLTFDGALRCQFDVAAPLLRERGLTALWFVPSVVLDGQPERFELHRHVMQHYFPTAAGFYQAFARELASASFAGEAEAALATFDPARYRPDLAELSDAERQFAFLREDVLSEGRFEAVLRALLRRHNWPLDEISAGLWMDEDALRTLQEDGHIIGLNSHSCPLRLGELDAAQQRNEYVTNLVRLKRALGVTPVAMAHPHNAYSRETIEMLRGLGVRLGFRMDETCGQGSELEFPRQSAARLLAVSGSSFASRIAVP